MSTAQEEAMLAELKAQVEKTQMALEKFAADQRSQLTASAIQHENVTNEEKENLLRAQAAFEQAKQAEAEAAQHAEAEQAEVAKLKGEIKEVGSHKSEVEKQRAALKKEVEKLQAKVAAEQQNLEVKKQQRVEQSQRSKRAIEFFVDRLGLSLVKSKDGSMAFVFSKIDPSNLDKPFICTLRIDSSNEFALVNCQPSLPNINALLDELRKSNDLSVFVKSVREGFRKSV